MCNNHFKEADIALVQFDLLFDICIVILYAIHMIRTFRHKGLQSFFRTGSKAGIQPAHAERLKKQLFALDNARSPGDMNAPGWRLHALSGQLDGHWAVDVSGNWRLTFAFDDTDAVLVDYRDYH
jgi:toxin HigB-1